MMWDIPWLELVLVVPVVGAIVVSRLRSSDQARSVAMVFNGVAFALSLLAWRQFSLDKQGDAYWPVVLEWFSLDELTGPLLPLSALFYLLTAIATLRTKIRRYSFVGSLCSETLVLATLAAHQPWLIIGLLALGTLPPYLELVSRRKPTRAYVLHMALFVVLLVIGQAAVNAEGTRQIHSLAAMLPLVIAVFIRSGIAPFHCWMTDLFEHASFGTALLFVAPMMGALAAVRLVVPIAPDSILQTLGWLSLVTAVYAGGMALVQREARRFFCYIFISHSALVLVGLETVSLLGLTGALCIWLSLGLSLMGFGLTLRALEARHGRLSLAGYHGVYENTPILAICFMLTGMASVGFPGTFGFIGTELLVDGVVTTYAYVGVAVVIAAALNGIAVLQAYFLLFTGKKQQASVPLNVGGREWFAVLTMVVLILGGGLFPQITVQSRHHAAEELLKERATIAKEQSPEELPQVTMKKEETGG